MPLITSFDAARQWSQQGSLVIEPTGMLFNGPVILVNRSLSLQDIGTLAPTLSPNEFLGIDPAIRTAYFKAHQGYYNGQLVAFLALEHDSGVVHHTPGAIPVPTIGTDVLGHGGIADFYEIDGQPPVIDSIPLRMAALAPGTVTTPPSTIYSNPGGPGLFQQPAAAPLYSPLWHVHRVAFTGASRPLLRSVAEIQQAASAGQVTVTAGSPKEVFNCPVPFYYQAGATTPVYTPPGTGGTPVTPIPGTTPGTPTPGTTTPGTTTPPTGGTSPGPY
jgi:hypothetical protein